MSGYIQGESNQQTTLFPPSFDELIPETHLVRVIHLYVQKLDLVALGFSKASPAQTGRPAYHPSALLKLYLYGYFHRIRSSRRLEAETQRNIEVMWLLERLTPDFKTIANFRSGNSRAFVATCKHFVGFCKEAMLIQGETVAIDGSKFQAVASGKRYTHMYKLEREQRRLEQQIQDYLKQLDKADETESKSDLNAKVIHHALKHLQHQLTDLECTQQVMQAMQLTQIIDGEPDAKMMRTVQGKQVSYNVQNAVDTAHGLIIHHDVTTDCNDQHQLLPMVKASADLLGDNEDNAAVSKPTQFIADAGYSNGGAFAALEDQGLDVYVPVSRGLNTTGEGGFYQATSFHYDETQDVYVCPAHHVLRFKQNNKGARVYQSAIEDCADCPLKPQCTQAKRRYITRHAHEAALSKMSQKMMAQPEMMRIRRSTVEHPFGNIKYWIMGNRGRFLVRGLEKVRGEMALAVQVYNLKRVINIKGVAAMLELLA